VQPYSHAPGIGILEDAFQRKETAATDNGGLNIVLATPALKAAVRVQNLRQ